MKTIRHGWLVLIALITSGGSSLAGTLTQDVADIRLVDSVSVRLMSSVPGIVVQQRIPLPDAVVHALAVKEVKTGRAAILSLQPGSIHLNQVLLQRGNLVLVGHRLVSQGVDLRGGIPVWLEEVRVTVPRHFLANSWDVLSLQRELERLGIKVKPKPANSKPTQQLSG